MSGGSLRSFEMKRSNSSSISVGIDRGDAEAVADAEFAAEPRPWQRMSLLAGEAHDVVHGQEVGA